MYVSERDGVAVAAVLLSLRRALLLFQICSEVENRCVLRVLRLMKLQHDVRACEYEDIRVMWEMLNRNESGFGNSPRKSKKRHYWKLFKWAKCAPYICRT